MCDMWECVMCDMWECVKECVMCECVLLTHRCYCG